MPAIALSRFVEFSLSNQTQRRASATRTPQPYDPRHDFYKPIRERVIRQFRSSWDARQFRESLESVSDPRKRVSYEQCRAGLSDWARGKTITYHDRHRASWSAGLLEVKVNPDLDLTIDGRRYLIKLHFNIEEPPDAKRDVILHLLNEVGPQSTSAAILDARRSRLITLQHRDQALLARLTSDAATYLSYSEP